MLEPVSVYAAAARRWPLERFTADFPHPILLVDPFAPLEDTGFGTLSGNLGARGIVESVAAIKKRPGANAFASMITLGRASNNDIKLAAQVVSKVHCYFTLEPNGTLSFTDAGSTNGSFHKGKKLQPRSERVTLTSGDEIRLGELKTIFLTSQGAWERFRGVGAVSPSQPTAIPARPAARYVEQSPTERILPAPSRPT